MVYMTVRENNPVNIRAIYSGRLQVTDQMAGSGLKSISTTCVYQYFTIR
jgi:hypothetical protein